MYHRLIGVALTGAMLAGSASGARSNTLLPLGITAPVQTRTPTRAPMLETNGTHLTVASVRLKLTTTIVDASIPGPVAQLLITAFDPQGKVIVGPGTYYDTRGNPLTIRIANSSQSNTTISATAFAGPMPAQGASNEPTLHTVDAHTSIMERSALLTEDCYPCPAEV